MNKFIFLVLLFIPFINIDSCSETEDFLSVKECNAIILGDSVSIYQEPGTDLNRIDFYDILTLAKISETTSQRILLDSAQTNCEKFGFFWYKIETIQGIKGWTYGKYIFEIITDAQGSSHFLLFGKKFIINNKDFYFGIAKDVSFPTINDDGLTGCEDLLFPFFFFADENKIIPIKFELETYNKFSELRTLTKNNWLILENSDKVIDKIEAVETVDNKIFITINRLFQNNQKLLNYEAEITDNYIEIVYQKTTYD